ncbi:OLC1v1037319C1 [Oldenlandia corymbosa var. corymbosa]|uniref:OLC1v1037319C1 n=1 Tax=Oldenlandia corymbosa var. corymbosa TaxID=529605 RepID=A0AAV1CYK8_OLDCO|nr:OLC1v1037319C1 [Oldenlandia corymbosa var. corymbosa]
MKLRRSITEEIYFPEEIWRRILLNLPTEILVRFSCVSKKWRDLIRDPSFGNAHVSYYIQQKRHNNAAFLLGRFRSCSFFDEYKRFHELLLTAKSEEGDQGNYDTIGNNFNFRFSVLSPGLDLPPYEFQQPYKIYGSCNGILCISKSSSRCHVYLCNPAIGECLRLPASYWDMGGFWDKSVLGFGFDVRTNDYKVIRLGRVGRNGSNRAYAEIYRLNTNCWTKLKVKVGSLMDSLAPAGGVFFNGSCYWSGNCKYIGAAILKFDFSTEIFSLVLPPYSKRTWNWISATPSVVSDSLALVLEGRLGLCEVWVMMVQKEEDGKESSSWSKKCSLRLRPELRFPAMLTCWNHDWLLLRSRCGRKIRCCFLEDGSTAQKDWGFDIGYTDDLCAVAFQPTLVSLKEKLKRIGLF